LKQINRRTCKNKQPVAIGLTTGNEGKSPRQYSDGASAQAVGGFSKKQIKILKLKQYEKD